MNLYLVALVCLASGFLAGFAVAMTVQSVPEDAGISDDSEARS